MKMHKKITTFDFFHVLELKLIIKATIKPSHHYLLRRWRSLVGLETEPSHLL